MDALLDHELEKVQKTRSQTPHIKLQGSINLLLYVRIIWVEALQTRIQARKELHRLHALLVHFVIYLDEWNGSLWIQFLYFWVLVFLLERVNPHLLVVYFSCVEHT